MPHLIRFMINEFTNGAVLGLVVAETVLWTNTGDLARLMSASPDSAALAALFFGHAAMLFGTLGLSVAVMTLSEEDR